MKVDPVVFVKKNWFELGCAGVGFFVLFQLKDAIIAAIKVGKSGGDAVKSAATAASGIIDKGSSLLQGLGGFATHPISAMKYMFCGAHVMQSGDGTWLPSAGSPGTDDPGAVWQADGSFIGTDGILHNPDGTVNSSGMTSEQAQTASDIANSGTGNTPYPGMTPSDQSYTNTFFGL